MDSMVIWFTINMVNHITIYILKNMRQKCGLRGYLHKINDDPTKIIVKEIKAKLNVN